MYQNNSPGLKKIILDLFFPTKCVGCGKDGILLCQECLEKIIYIKSPSCPSCNKLTPKGQYCPRCRQKTPLTGIMVSAHFDEGPLKEAIHTYKYNYVSKLAEPLSNILIEHLQAFPVLQNTIIISVPLHKSRLRQRGFNQSTLLAKKVSESFELPILENKLIRQKATLPQIELSGKERQSNVLGAFSWVGKNEVVGKRVLLIDDVCTTGATLRECGKELRKVGAKEVWGLVLARH